MSCAAWLAIAGLAGIVLGCALGVFVAMIMLES
jgi:hypothetical protein